MNKKNWLVRTYDENDNVLTVQLLKGLTMEEAYVESAAIVAAGKPTPRITKNWLARVFDESGQVVNAWAIKNRTEFEALVDANAVADGSIKYAVVELGSIEAIELVDFILKKNGVGGKASYAIGPIDIPGTTDRFIVMTTVAKDADPIAVQNATSQAHDNSLSLMTSKSLGLI